MLSRNDGVGNASVIKAQAIFGKKIQAKPKKLRPGQRVRTGALVIGFGLWLRLRPCPFPYLTVSTHTLPGPSPSLAPRACVAQISHAVSSRLSFSQPHLNSVASCFPEISHEGVQMTSDFLIRCHETSEEARNWW